MIGSLLRARNLLAIRSIPKQICKNYCEQQHPAPSQKDFLSSSVGGDPFYIVPFQLKNHIRFTITFMLFFAIPFWAPPIVVHLQLYKRQQG